MRLELAVDGHDGAAKTPLVSEVVRQARAAGLDCVISAPFREASALRGRDVYDLWSSAPGDALALVAEAVRQAREATPAGSLLVFDRHWMTVMVEVGGTPLEAGWTDFVPTLYARTTYEHLRRSSRFDEATPWVRSRDVVEAYRARYDAVGVTYAPHVLGTVTVECPDTDLEPVVSTFLCQVLS